MFDLVASWWFNVWHAWISAWHGLTPAQGTVIGGLFVVAAGTLAFANGWRDRRARERRYHYEEVKRVYTKAIELVSRTTLCQSPVQLGVDPKVVGLTFEDSLKTGVDVLLTGDSRTSMLVSEFLLQEAMGIGSAPVNIKPSVDGTVEIRQIRGVEVIEQVRQELARYVPRTSRYGRSLRRRISKDRRLLFSPVAGPPAPSAGDKSDSKPSSADEAAPAADERGQQQRNPEG